MAGRDVIVELGCGTGQIAAYLAAQDIRAVGLDISPAMISEARRLFPDAEFVVGDMLALPFGRRSIDGLVGFYSIIHFDDEQLTAAFAEMARVLDREGLLALAFHVGDELIHREEWWGETVDLDARHLQPDRVEQLLADAGLETIARLERDPYEPPVEYQSRRCYLVARPLVPLPGGRSLPPMGLGYPGTPLREELVAAVLRGAKTATAGLAEEFAPLTHEPLPGAGDRWALLGTSDEPVAIVETTEVRLVPAGEVDLQFALNEGEGFESVADWRAAHERFWSERGLNDDSLIVCERFRVLEKIDP